MMTRATILCGVFLLLIAVESVYSWQNGWDGNLYVVCGNRQGFNRVQSYHHNYYEDRRWQWTCVTRATENFDHCYWTSYVNNWRWLIGHECLPNYIINGVNSYHSNSQEDRRWRYYCCRAPHHFKQNCELSNYVNGYDGSFDHNVGSKVINGMYSGYSTHGHK